jgi:hypothetical protein
MIISPGSILMQHLISEAQVLILVIFFQERIKKRTDQAMEMA